MRRLLRLFLPALMLLAAAPAHAQLTIEITRGVEAGIPIAIVPFEVRGGSAPQHDMAQIIESNLQRSGRFDPVPRGNFMSRPSDHTQVQYREWRQLNADNLVVGRIDSRGNEFSVQFQLFDVIRGQQLGGFRYNIPATQVRKLAHQISDWIYEQLTGEPGAFDTRIAYVTVEREDVDNARYLLQVADSDGYGPRTVLQSREPIMSPAWSPDGQRLAYVSFEERRPIVYVQRLADGQRQKVADSPGINSAPAWSPDGRRLALTLSRDGNPEIYTLDVETRALTRLTNDLGIDTEPSWSPDGRHIVFTSDRSGRPQVYRMRADGSQLERLTFDGRYNARASWSPDGERLVLVTNQGSGFQIAQLHLRSGALQVLTDRRNDESPSYAPNGRLIIYATEERGRGTLAVVSADGRVRQSLRFQEGDVREPAWSPLNPQL